MGVVNDSPDKRIAICPHARQIPMHENRHKNPTTMRTRNVEKSGHDWPPELISKRSKHRLGVIPDYPEQHAEIRVQLDKSEYRKSDQKSDHETRPWRHQIF